MFAITSTRIVGLMAVVCAVVVAPQALAAPSAHSRIAPPDAVGVDLSGFDLKAGFYPKAASRIAPPDAAQGYDLSGFDLTVFNNLPGYREQQEYLAAVAAAASYKSFRAVTKAIAIKSATAAAIAALQRRGVALDAAYRKLYPGLYTQPAQTSDKEAVWSFPAFCNEQAMVDYDYIIYSRCQG